MNYFQQYINKKQEWIKIIHNIEINLFSLTDSNFKQVENDLLQTHFSSSCETTINFLDLFIIAMRSRPKNIHLYRKLYTNFNESINRYHITNETYNKIHPSQPNFYQKFDFNDKKTEIENTNDKQMDITNINDLLFNLILNDDIDRFQYVLSHYDLTVNSTINLDSVTTFNFFPKGTKIDLIDLASYFSSIRIFKFLILSKCDISDETFLYSVFGGNSEIIHILEDKIRKTNFEFNQSHLMIAIQTHQSDIIEYVINHIENWRITPEVMSQCIEFYNLDFFISHVSEINELINGRSEVITENGVSLLDSFSRLLFDCLRCRHVDMLDILLHLPAINPNVRGEIFAGIEGTILHAASRIYNHSYAKYILKCGRIDTNALTSFVGDFFPRKSSLVLYAKGLTSLHIAVLRNDAELVKILLETTKQKVDSEVNPIQKVDGEVNHIQKASSDVNLIQKASGEVNSIQKAGGEVTSRFSFDPNVKMPVNNETPLHFACRNNAFEIVQLLADDDRVDKNALRVPKFKFFDGKTPADISLMHFDMKSFGELRKAGGKLSNVFLFIFLFHMALFVFSIWHVTATLLKITEFQLYLTILEVGTIFRIFSSSINDRIFDEDV